MEFTDAPSSVATAADWSQNVLSPEAKQPDDNNEQFTSKGRVQFYSDNAQSYDTDMVEFGFRGPEVTAQTIHQVLNERPDAYILDVGCGTGKVAEELNKLGDYKNIDGLEPAKGMLDLAERKGLYKKYMNQYFHINSGIPHNTYDAVLTSGTFVMGHLKSDCMEELCNIVKPGGYVVVVMRDEHITTVEEYRLNLRKTVERMVDEKRWKCIEDRTFPDWCFGKSGAGIAGRIFFYQKC